MAGYCGVQHALQLRGIDGNYGPARKIYVLSLGPVSRAVKKVLDDATDIRQGNVLNKDILAYQHRSEEYPHKSERIQ
jgi:hypothetical protein